MSDEMDWEWEQQKQNFEEFEKNATRYLQEKQQKQAAIRRQQALEKSCEKHGMTVDEYFQLRALDPEFDWENYEDHQDQMVYETKTRQKARDPRTGQFVKESRAGVKSPAKEPTGPDFTELKERAKHGTVSDDDIIAALFPDPLWKE